MHLCPECLSPFVDVRDLQTHMEIKHDLPISVALIRLYLDMSVHPDNKDKRLTYFEALADGRLSDVYSMVERIKDAQLEIERLQRMLYDMTSLRDWQLAGYDSAEYDALYAKFESEESEAE